MRARLLGAGWEPRSSTAFTAGAVGSRALVLLGLPRVLALSSSSQKLGDSYDRHVLHQMSPKMTRGTQREGLLGQQGLGLGPAFGTEEFR